jgi:hypothetical protein
VVLFLRASEAEGLVEVELSHVDVQSLASKDRLAGSSASSERVSLKALHPHGVPLRLISSYPIRVGCGFPTFVLVLGKVNASDLTIRAMVIL